MSRLFKSFFFKLSKDLAFRITLFIGLGLAIVTTFSVFLLEILAADTLGEEVHLMSGSFMLTNSLSPVDNFGLAIPVNLICFVCLEFSQGSIRNKIIAGHSKSRIYASLFCNGLLLCLFLMGSYVLLCTLLGTLLGGFGLDGGSINVLTMSAIKYTSIYLIQMVLITLAIYVCIVSFTVFISCLLRNIGPCIPIVLMAMIGLYFIGAISSSLLGFFEDEALMFVSKLLNPMYGLMAGEVSDSGVAFYSLDTVIICILSNLVYATIFFVGGLFIFKNRDVK